MNSNNSQKYKNKNDQRILNKNYVTAQECEKNGKYKKAIELYNINITKYNDPLSKVSLANLYLSGKTRNIDNRYARKLLEEAYNQGCNYGKSLLAYTMANGIGGKKEENKAYSMFLDEIDGKNPEPMVYLEIIKYMKKTKKNKKLIKSLKECVTISEIMKYNRKVSIDKFNNTKIGQLVNKIPNYISTQINNLKDIYGENKYSKDLGKLYNKANNLYKNEDYDTARRIYKRLSLYGDLDSKIKYAKMCYQGIGGKVDIEAAREIYTGIMDKRNVMLSRIKDEISNTKKFIKEVKKEKNSFHNSKIIKSAKEDIQYLKNKKSKIYMNTNYNEACLQYGVLLVENYKNNNDLKKGIEILKLFAQNGEYNTLQNQRLTQYGKQYNRRARIAIKKLGNLYESGEWIPENLEEAKKMFNKFALGKISKYTSYISDKMAGKTTYTRKIISENKKVKQYRITYTLASICELLSINSIARKLYTKMCEGGNYRGAYSLASFEHKGKGGSVDLESAKKHYRDYIRSKVNCEEKDERILRFYAVNDLATLHLKENDLITAIQLYKLAAKNGNSAAKKHLKTLYKEGRWLPENSIEQKWVKPNLVEKILKKPEISLFNNKEAKRKFSMPRIDIKKPVSAAIAAATAFSVFSSNNTILKVDSYEEGTGIQAADRNKMYNYVIGDKVGILKNNILENSQIVDFAAYNSEKQTRIGFDNNEINYKKFGFSSEEYIEKIIKEKNINKNSIRILYCVKNGNEIKWVNPLEDDIVLLKKYKDVKKEEDYSEYHI